MNNENYDDILEKHKKKRLKRKYQEMIKRKKRQRIIVILISFILIFFIIFGISSCISSCVKKSDKNRSEYATENTTLQYAETTTQNTNSIADNGDNGYYTDSNIYIWNNQAFELFDGDENKAKTYASLISRCANTLDNSINVYNMVVPTHISMGLPERLEKSVNSKNQSDYIKTIYKNYNTNITAIDIFSSLEKHKTEYIFFNTDHRWTTLGAYYAYKKFCNVAGEKSVDINSLKFNEINGFAGSLYSVTGLEILKNNADTIRYYDVTTKYTVNILKSNSNEYQKVNSIYNEDAVSGKNSYDVFIWGDNPVTKIINSQNKNGKNILVIKDSYANSFVNWLVNNYDEVHIIDFSYYKGSVPYYCNKNQITDVLFINDVMSSINSFQLENISNLF